MTKLVGLGPVKLAGSHLHRKVFQKFADRLGFVYFGYVDQRDDEHRLIRGLTLSPNHRDDHYTIGTYHNYDVTLCERTDTIEYSDGPRETKKWLIMAVDLHHLRDAPHVFIGQKKYSQAFYTHILTKFAYFQRFIPGSTMPYAEGFGQHFVTYSSPTHFIEAERLFGGQISETLSQHFSDFSFELAEQVLYIYSENIRATDSLLSRMLQCAAWLASELDTK